MDFGEARLDAVTKTVEAMQQNRRRVMIARASDDAHGTPCVVSSTLSCERYLWRKTRMTYWSC